MYHFSITRGITKTMMDALFKDFTHASNFTLKIPLLFLLFLFSISPIDEEIAAENI